MELAIVDQGDLKRATIVAHELDANVADVELFAAVLRRAASLQCPTTPNELLTSAARALCLNSVDALTEILDSVIASGDLVEWPELSAGIRRRTIFLGAPSFVRRDSGDVILIGTRPDATSLVGEELSARVEMIGHLRWLPNASADDVSGLKEYGLREITDFHWLGHKEPRDAQILIDEYDALLQREQPSGDIEELSVLDPNTSTNFYRGRWRIADHDMNGQFVSRRGQGYGADLWCYVQVREGRAERFVDLPIDPQNRGCDEAWQLQAAIDKINETPQRIIFQSTGNGRVKLGITMPPPRWLQRRWDLLGKPVKVRGALSAYEFRAQHVRDELKFVKEHLWMEPQLVKEIENV